MIINDFPTVFNKSTKDKYTLSFELLTKNIREKDSFYSYKIYLKETTVGFTYHIGVAKFILNTDYSLNYIELSCNKYVKAIDTDFHLFLNYLVASLIKISVKYFSIKILRIKYHHSDFYNYFIKWFKNLTTLKIALSNFKMGTQYQTNLNICTY